MTHRPTFSVAVPCYNYGRFLGECVESIATQDGVDVGVLVIDDCSTDDSAEVADRLCTQWTNVQVLRHRVNQGHIVTFNDGVDWATGDYFVLISADDLLAPGALRRAGEVMSAAPHVGMCYGSVVPFTEPDELAPVDMATPHPYVWDGRRWIGRLCRLGENPTYSPEIVLRTDVQRQIGHYDARCRHTSDLNTWLRAAAVSDVAFLPGTIQAYYRVHGANMSRTAFAAQLDQIEQWHRAFAAFFEWSPGRTFVRDERIAGASIAKRTLWEASKSFQHGGRSSDLDQTPYVDLARRADPHVERRMAYWGLRLRRRLGPLPSLLFPPFLAARAVRAVRRALRNRSHAVRGA